jgi:excisionase family DNA binding protein
MQLIPELLTAREVAAALRVDVHTVTRWARTDQIGCVRLPGGRLRFPRAELDRLLAGQPVAQ